MPAPVVDGASFRDPSGHVFSLDGRILRTVTEAASPAYEQMRDSGLLDELAENGYLIKSSELDRDSFSYFGNDVRHGTVQALLRQNALGDEFDLLKDLDVGDFLGVNGRMIRTRTGQVTIEAQHLTVAAKGMRPLPEKWHGLRDVEIRYRQRYLDLISNPEVMPVFGSHPIRT